MHCLPVPRPGAPGAARPIWRSWLDPGRSRGGRSAEARDAAAEACARLDAGVEVPWVILSAGVGYDDFKRQVEIASAAGGSGFLAGRSIWRDAVSVHHPERRRLAARQAAGRLAELAAITRAVGRPFRPALEGKDLIGAVAEDWYVDWQR